MRRRWLGTVKVCGLWRGVVRLRCIAPSLMAQVSSYGDKETGPTTTSRHRSWAAWALRRIWNAQLPLSLTLLTTRGKAGGNWAATSAGKPAILALVYYQCPIAVLGGVERADRPLLQMVDEAQARTFNVIVVSIDPSEGTDLAAAKKRSYVKRYGHSETAAGWHFMTGTQANIGRAQPRRWGLGYVKIPRAGWKADRSLRTPAPFRSLRRKASWRSTTWAWSIRPRTCGWDWRSFVEPHRIAGG